jgi:uncharacterized protein
MEEILASIRRIIADDDAGKPNSSKPTPASMTARADAKTRQNEADAMPRGFDTAADQAAGDSVEAEVMPGVIALDEAVQARAPTFNGIDQVTNGVFDRAPGLERVRAPEPVPMPDRSLLSPHTTAAVDTAFNSLAHTVLMQSPRTLEDLVREMLKPILKAWLDDNLPHIVERLVRAEIERVSRGRG